MTLSPWLIYLAGIADNFEPALSLLCVFSMAAAIIIFVIYLIVSTDDYSKDEELAAKLKPCSIRLFIFSIFTLIVALLMPSSDTVYKMMIIPAVVNSNVVQKLPDELQQYIDKVLKTPENVKNKERDQSND